MIQPIVLQRIIDGECTPAERATFLASLGEDISSWKAVALAAIEEQQFAREIASVQSAAHSQAALPLNANLGHVVVNSHKQGSLTRSHWNWMSALAAGFLFLVGLYGGSWMRGRQPSFETAGSSGTGSIVENQRTLPTPMRTHSPFRNDGAAPVRMVMSGSADSDSEIPLYDAQEIDPQLLMANEAYEIAKLNQRLRRRGYEVDVQPQFYSGRLQDGRQVVVPVHNVSLKPVGL